MEHNVVQTDAVAGIAYEIARHGFDHEFGKPKIEGTPNHLWEKLIERGTRLWLDTGDFTAAAKIWSPQFKALTTNNTLLNKEVQKGIYDKLIVQAAKKIKNSQVLLDEKRFLMEVSFVLNAYHALRLVELFDAHVSVELHTDLADDVEQSVYYAQRYYEICPERFYIKVPLTPAGFLAARKLGKLGIPVNFTLGFSARQNYLAAALSLPVFTNVFLGRLNSFISDNKLGDGRNIGEKATLAAQRHILSRRGLQATPTLLIGASLREAGQIPALAGVDVLTMPPKVAADYLLLPASDIHLQLASDPDIRLAEGFTIDSFNGATLWEVPETFKACVNLLLKMNIDTFRPIYLQEHFAEHHFADFLPFWSDDDIRTVIADGKIPVYQKWKDRLAAKNIGLDALMNISALYSFATDQKALDARIKSLL